MSKSNVLMQYADFLNPIFAFLKHNIFYLKNNSHVVVSYW